MADRHSLDMTQVEQIIDHAQRLVTSMDKASSDISQARDEVSQSFERYAEDLESQAAVNNDLKNRTLSVSSYDTMHQAQSMHHAQTGMNPIGATTLAHASSKSILSQHGAQETAPLGWLASSEHDAFTRSLYIAVHGEGLLQQLQTLQEYRRALESNIQAASLRSHRVRWFFASKAKKQDADDAATALITLLDPRTPAFTTAKQTVAQTQTLCAVTDQQAWSDIASNNQAYLEAARRLAPQRFDEPMLPVVREVMEPVSQMQRIVQESDSRVGEARAAVTTAVNAMQQQEAIATLHQASVDDLRPSLPQGIRLGALKNAGIVSILDVTHASVSQLAAIRGITTQTAIRIKQEASAYALSIVQATPLKISSDSRTPEATELLRAVWRYRHSKGTAETLERIHAYDAQLVPAVDAVRLVGNGCLWPLLTERNKDGVAQALNVVQGMVHGEYAQLVARLPDAAGRLPGAYSVSNETAGIVADPESAVVGSTEITSAETISEADLWIDFERDSIAYFTAIEEVCPDALGGGNGTFGVSEELATAINGEPLNARGLTCELRRYQEWGVKYILHQKRVLLGDQMGLGKTIEAIAAMVSLHNVGATHFIVVCPASVLVNWEREVSSKSALTAYVAHGEGIDAAIREWVRAGGVAITTFGMCGRLREVCEGSAVEETGNDARGDVVQGDVVPNGAASRNSFPAKPRAKLDMLVVDEAHYVKNPAAKRTKRVAALSQCTDRVLFMTGTPLENRVDEMTHIISLLRPDIAQRLGSMQAGSYAPQFRAAVSEVYLRRKRDDVLAQLPEKEESEEWCMLKPRERAVYEQTVMDGNWQQMRQISWNVDDLRDSSKADRLDELVADATEDGRKIIVYSYYLHTIDAICQRYADRVIGPINGSVSPADRQRMVDAFNAAPAGTILVAQVEAGGTGLNIQSASVIIFCEPQLKPSIEDQAISRAYRMGQTRNVLVFRLLCVKSVDERITQMLDNKRGIFEAFADKSVAADTVQELDAAGLDSAAQKDIIAEEIDRITRERAAARQAQPAGAPSANVGGNGSGESSSDRNTVSNDDDDDDDDGDAEDEAESDIKAI
ncbi:MAG: DEAD/DEAH box helicase [Bifidobacteriaceae bacterium]|nr:DEAD/DEAH box helicase [Bifidobacteriaceae bacterium]